MRNKLKARIEQDIRRHEPMAVRDIDAAMSAIDFKAFWFLDDEPDDPSKGYTVDNGVAKIDVRGLLIPAVSYDARDYGVTGYDQIARYIADAESNPEVERIVLDVDSGGGYVKGLSIATAAIENSQKPIETFVSGDAYSAAYWLASTTETITAADFSGLGSIGVLMMHEEHSSALEKWGYKVSVIRSGKWKAAFNDVEPLTDEQKKRLQDDCDSLALDFFNHVASHRGMSAEMVESWQADTFNAKLAKSYGMIDKIESNFYALIEAGGNMAADNPQNTAQAEELAALKQQLAERDNTIATMRADNRKAEIKALAEKTGKTFSDDEAKHLAALDDAAFKTMAGMLTVAAPKADNTTALNHLFTEQALAGREPTDDNNMDAKVRAWGAK